MRAKIIFIISIILSISLLTYECVQKNISIVNYKLILNILLFYLLFLSISYIFDYKILRKSISSITVIMFGNLLHPAIEHISLRFHRPFISISLARIDAALGLDWASYYNFIHHNTFIEFLTREAYSLFDIQLLICPLALALSDKENVVMKYFARISTCLLIVDLIFIFYPADNASILYKIYDADPEKWHNDIIFCMNSRSKLYDITSNLDGLVSFPSFHAGGAIILIYSVYKMKLFFPFLLNGILIIMAVPAWGGHYFIDAIAGVFVAIFSILLVDFPLEWLPIACLMRIKRN